MNKIPFKKWVFQFRNVFLFCYKTVNNCLKKIGLKYEDEIYIHNKFRWEEVSMNCRKDYGMPSTTNTLEAMHGQINHHVQEITAFILQF